MDAFIGAFHILNCLALQSPVPEIDRSGFLPSYQKRPGLNDVMIEWDRMDSTEICCLIRACNPWNKGAITFANKQELKMMDARITGESIAKPAGTILGTDGKLIVACSDCKAMEVKMFYFQEFYCPSRYLSEFGFKTGNRLG